MCQTVGVDTGFSYCLCSFGWFLLLFVCFAKGSAYLSQIVLELFGSAFALHSSFLQYYHLLTFIENTNLMGDQDNCLRLAERLYAPLLNLPRNLGVYCWDRVIQKVNVSLKIKRPRQRDSRFLSSRKSYSLFPDKCLISFVKNLKIRDKAGLLDDLLVEVCVELFAENDVIFDGLWEDYGFLLHEGYFPWELKHSWVVGHLSSDGPE